MYEFWYIGIIARIEISLFLVAALESPIRDSEAFILTDARDCEFPRMDSLAGYLLLQLAACICMQYALHAADQFICESANGRTEKPFPYTLNLLEGNSLPDKNSYCKRIIYTFPAARRQELIDNPPVLLSVYSKSPIWGKLDLDTLKVINEGYTTQVFLWHNENLKNPGVRSSLWNYLHICQSVAHDSGCKSPLLSISFEIIIAEFTPPRPNLTLLTPLGGGLVLRNTSASDYYSKWKLEFSLVKNSEAFRRVPQLSFMASNWHKQTAAANDINSYKPFEGQYWYSANSWMLCVCGEMKDFEYWQAVRMNFSGTQMDVTFGPALPSGNQFVEIDLDFRLEDRCAQNKYYRRFTDINLVVELSNAGVFHAHLSYIFSSYSY